MVEVGVIVGVIVGLVQAAKVAGLPSNYAPVLSIALGIAASLFVGLPEPVGVAVFNGILYGLTASGLYSGVRATVR